MTCMNIQDALFIVYEHKRCIVHSVWTYKMHCSLYMNIKDACSLCMNIQNLLFIVYEYTTCIVHYVWTYTWHIVHCVWIYKMYYSVCIEVQNALFRVFEHIYKKHCFLCMILWFLSNTTNKTNVCIILIISWIYHVRVTKNIHKKVSYRVLRPVISVSLSIFSLARSSLSLYLFFHN